jgi:NTP pyrophosphatase (non-canonical NTP hydrolase)
MNKIVKPFISTNHELLQLLQEECAEVIQAASKIIRFGEEKNIQQLETELGDLQAILGLLHEFNMVSYSAIDEASQKKLEKLKIYSNIYS